MNVCLSACQNETLFNLTNNIIELVKMLNTHKNLGQDVEGADDSNFPKDNP